KDGAAPKRFRMDVRGTGRTQFHVVAGPIARARNVRTFRFAVDIATFQADLPANRKLSPRDGARILKHPTGVLPLEAPDEITIGGNRRGGEIPTQEPQAPLQGRIDEVRIAPDTNFMQWNGNAI